MLIYKAVIVLALLSSTCALEGKPTIGSAINNASLGTASRNLDIAVVLLSGVTIKIREVAPDTDADNRVNLSYETQIDLDNRTDLSKEIKEVWDLIRQDVEIGKFDVAAIRAFHYEKTRNITHGEGAGHLVVRADDGTWNWVTVVEERIGSVGVLDSNE